MKLSKELLKIIPPELRNDIVEAISYLEGIELDPKLRNEVYYISRILECDLYEDDDEIQD